MSSKVSDFIQAVTKAKTYDLGQPYYTGMPVFPEDPPFLQYLYRYHEHSVKIFKEKAPGFADSCELIITSMHSGTHIDARCHMSKDGKIFGGTKAADIESHRGYDKFGIEEVGVFVKRAVMLDIPAYKQVDILTPRYAIGKDDLSGCEKHQNTMVREGDAVLVRTGYSRYFVNEPERYRKEFAGTSLEGATWLAQKKPVLAGIDNLAFGVPMPFETHLKLLVENGIFMIKSLNLEELSRNKIYEFVLVVTPLKSVGATGSLVSPIAIVP